MDEMNIEFDPTKISELQMQDPSTVNAPAPEARPRRKKSKKQIFKETTLPLIIVAVAAFLILVFIIGSITRGVQKRKIEKEASIAASSAIAEEEARLAVEAESILKESEILAAGYDYDSAIALVDSFSGNIGAYPHLQDARTSYESGKSKLVAWDDPNTIINISFQHLIADSGRAFSHEELSQSLKNNFITITEFQNILERMYENNYVLVTIDDFAETVTENNQIRVKYKPLYLPEGKKPVVLTQTNVNYSLYLVDSDDDFIADREGAGIASKLVFDDEGNVACELINADGSVSVGAYDLIPILDAFVEKHPDFSYHGSKALLALTGYNGIFGYRTNPGARAVLGEEQYEKDVRLIKEIADRLVATGYDFACYSYANSNYEKMALANIQKEMSQWDDEVVPILGQIDTFVFAQNADITTGVNYSGNKFDYLYSHGFRYFVGFCAEGDPYTSIADDYLRQARLLVTGSKIKEHPAWFNVIFDTKELLDENR